MGNICCKNRTRKPVKARNSRNTEIVEDLIKSQEEKTGTHSSQRKIVTQIN